MIGYCTVQTKQYSCKGLLAQDVEWRTIALNNNNITLEIRLHHPSLSSRGETSRDFSVLFQRLFCSLSTSFSLAVEEIKTESDAVDGMEVSMPPKGIFSLILM